VSDLPRPGVGSVRAEDRTEEYEPAHLARPGSRGSWWRAPVRARQGHSERPERSPGPRSAAQPTTGNGAEWRAVAVAERGEWVSRGETKVYMGGWVDLAVADVTTPTGQQLRYEVVRARSQGVAGLVVDHSDCVLLLWRHRFVTQSWGLELPAGSLRAGEHPVRGAEREVLEETGWSTYDGRLVWSVARAPERSDHIGHLVWLRAEARVGPVDPDEVAQLHWLDRRQVRQVLADGQVHDVFTLGALWWWLSVGDGGEGQW
jgi:8-oxo-dGTP pyrophosphatase MutT (NUDIX family)